MNGILYAHSYTQAHKHSYTHTHSHTHSHLHTHTYSHRRKPVTATQHKWQTLVCVECNVSVCAHLYECVCAHACLCVYACAPATAWTWVCFGKFFRNYLFRWIKPIHFLLLPAPLESTIQIYLLTAEINTNSQKHTIIVIIIIIIINLIYIAQFNTNGILTALYVVIMYIQMQCVRIWTYMKQSYSYTHTCLHINTYTNTCTNIYIYIQTC